MAHRSKAVLAAAQDILANIRRIRAVTSTFVGETTLPANIIELKSEDQAAVLQKKCNACALGSVMLSLVKIYDAYDFWLQDAVLDSVCYFNGLSVYSTEHLDKYMSPWQQYLIENAFEGCDAMTEQPDNKVSKRCVEEIHAARAYAKRYKSPRTRLKAIMENVVANGGKFVPEPL